MKLKIFAAFCLLLIQSISLSQPQEAPSLFGHTRYKPSSWDWTKEAWTGNDKPFIALRARIDSEIKRVPKTQLLNFVRRYEKKASVQPQSAQAQFAWGYAAYRSWEQGLDFDIAQRYEFWRRIGLAIYDAPSPKAYQYARVKFLVSMRWSTFRELTEVGQRLLKRNPKDIMIKLYVTRLLAQGGDAQKKQALKYARELINSRPQWAGGYGALGGVYKEVFFDTKDISAGDKAIAAYQKSISLSPPGARLDNTKYLINIIRQTQAEWRTQKNKSN